MTKPNPYQPPRSDPEDQSPGVGQWIGIVMSSLIAGSIVFVVTCFGSGVVMFDGLGPENKGIWPDVVLIGVVTTGFGVAYWVATSLYKDVRRKNESTPGTDDDLAE